MTWRILPLSENRIVLDTVSPITEPLFTLDNINIIIMREVDTWHMEPALAWSRTPKPVDSVFGIQIRVIHHYALPDDILRTRSSRSNSFGDKRPSFLNSPSNDEHFLLCVLKGN